MNEKGNAGKKKKINIMSGYSNKATWLRSGKCHYFKFFYNKSNVLLRILSLSLKVCQTGIYVQMKPI